MNLEIAKVPLSGLACIGTFSLRKIESISCINRRNSFSLFGNSLIIDANVS